MAEQQIRAREKLLLPVYTQVACSFADMHDTPHRMYAKGVLQGIVPWREARGFFAARLKRRLTEEALVRHVITTDVSVSRRAAIRMVRGWYSMGAMGGLQGADPASPMASALAINSSFSFWGDDKAPGAAGGAPAAPAAVSGAGGANMHAAQLEADRAFLAWAESAAGRAQIAMELKGLRAHAASRLVQDMLATAEGKEGLLKGLQQVLTTDSALSTQLRAMLPQARP
jgi:acetyl-CoA carboxylase/biotin carboxylase 1